MTTKHAFLGGLIACAFVLTANAQSGSLPVVPPINNWTYLDHASTPVEGVLRGRAAVVSAAGQAAYLQSVAAVNYQEALRRRIENARLYTSAYIESKEALRDYRERYAPTPPTKEQWARITAKMLPRRLTADDFNPVTGGLIWPHVLRTDEYKALRERIDELIASRTPENSGDGSPLQREIAELIDAMMLLLKSNIDTLTASQYASAKDFLRSVAYEMTFPVSSAQPAADQVAVNVDNRS